MTINGRIAAAALVAVSAGATSANAFEFGSSGFAQAPGITLGGGTAGAPPPGLYSFNQVFTYQSNLVGPGAPNVGGAATPVHTATEASGLLWVPGWTLFGATYDAVIVQPWIMVDVGSPINVQQAGMHNTFIVPAELSWRLGDSGFFVKTGLGIHVPNGSISGPAGLNSVGNPWWTFQPELVVSYLKDGWNFDGQSVPGDQHRELDHRLSFRRRLPRRIHGHQDDRQLDVRAGGLLCRPGDRRQVERVLWQRDQRQPVQQLGRRRFGRLQFRACCVDGLGHA